MKIDINNTMNVQPLSYNELNEINGGGWEAFWKALGYWYASSLPLNTENYDQEGEMSALENYGSPY